MSSRIKRRARGMLVLGGGTALIVMMIVASGLMIWRGRQDAVREWSESLSGFSTVISEHTLQSVKAADLVLKSISARLSQPGTDVWKTCLVLAQPEFGKVARQRAEALDPPARFRLPAKGKGFHGGLLRC
jgi:hypothetical protein